MSAIDPTARIEAGAVIDPQATIGPYCVIGPNVVIGAGCRLVAHVHVTGHTKIGPGTVIYPFSSLGTPPQSVKYRGAPTRLVIGAACDIREHVTMNTGTEGGGAVTTVGDHCFFMVGTHVGHDCTVGSNVTFANNAVIGGHVTIGDHSVLGGEAAVHQFVRVGESAMVAGLSGVAADVIPFGFAIGLRAVLDGPNIVGLKRRGYSRAQMHRVRQAYRALFLGSGQFADRIEAVARAFEGDPIVGKIVTFIREGGSRSLMKPQIPRAAGAGVDDTS